MAPVAGRGAQPDEFGDLRRARHAVGGQERRLCVLEEQVAALRGCLDELGLLRAALLDARLHRERFARARREHPLGGGPGGLARAGLPDVVRARELAAALAVLAGPAALAPLAAACRRTGAAAAEALPAVAARFNRFVYVAGGIGPGLDGRRAPLASAERFDPAAAGGRGAWAPVEAPAEERAGAAGARLAGALALCGGRSAPGAAQALRSGLALGPAPGAGAAGAWEALPPLPAGRAYAGAAALRGRLYVCGGFDGTGYLAECVRFCPVQRTWEALPPMSQRRSHLVAAAWRGRLCVCGGKGDTTLRLNSVESLAVCEAGAAWEPLAPLAHPRSQAAGAVVAGALHVCGGFDGAQHLHSAERLVADGEAWTALPPMAEARSNAAAASLAGTLLILGGYDGDRDLRTCEAFRVADQTWAPIAPMLSERSLAAAATLWCLPRDVADGGAEVAPAHLMKKEGAGEDRSRLR